MTRRSWLLLISGVAAAQIVTPRIGFIVDANGKLREVKGVAGAFTIGSALEEGVVSAAYSGRSLVVKKASELRVDDRTLEAPEGRATVVFDAKGHVSEIFFPEGNTLWALHDGEFSAMPAHDLVSDTYVREGELFVKGTPVRLAREPRQVSQLGDEWLAVYADDRIFAVHGADVFELPEVED